MKVQKSKSLGSRHKGWWPSKEHVLGSRNPHPKHNPHPRSQFSLCVKRLPSEAFQEIAFSLYLYQLLWIVSSLQDVSLHSLQRRCKNGIHFFVSNRLSKEYADFIIQEVKWANNCDHKP